MLGHEALPAPVLRDQGDAGLDRVARVGDPHRLAGDPDLAADQRVDAAEHPGQRAAAAAQEAGDAHHLAAMDDEIDVLRLPRPRDAAQLDQRLADCCVSLAQVKTFVSPGQIALHVAVMQ